MATQTLAQVYKSWVTEGIGFASNLLPTNGLLNILPFKPASFGNQERYEWDSTTASISTINSTDTVAITGNSTTQKSINLQFYVVAKGGNKNFINSYNGGEQAYWNSMANKMNRGLRNKFAYNAFYGDTSSGNYNGYYKTAELNSDVLTVTASTGTTDIFFIRFEEQASEGLFNEFVLTNGELVKFDRKEQWIGTGDAVSDMIVGSWTSALAVKANAGYCAVIEGVKTTNKPTKAQIKEYITKVGGYGMDASNTFIVTSAVGWNILGDILGDDLNSTNFDKGEASDAIASFNGIRVVIDDAVQTNKTTT